MGHTKQKGLIVKKVCGVFIIIFCICIVPSGFPALAHETYQVDLFVPARSTLWYFYLPEGVAADSLGHVYVADTYKHRIQKFHSNGDFLSKWGDAGEGSGEFCLPSGVAVDFAGYVYVADTLNQRIQRFNSTGKCITKWGCQSSGNGQFHYPFEVTTDHSGHLYVADTSMLEGGRFQ